MIIKKFQAKTELEATENAKKELGPNVVVMNVRTVKQKGFFSFLKSPYTEVTVALEEETEKMAAAEKAAPARETKPLNFNTALDHKIDLLADERNASSGAFKEDSGEKKAIEERLDSLKTLIEETLQKPENAGRSVSVEEAEEEPEETESESAVFMKLLYRTMIENEINEVYANQMIDDMEKTDRPDVAIDYMLGNVYQKMVLKFGTPSIIQETENKPKVIFFIGPTGVGKTTTIAKIASRFCVEQKKKVTLLTADTYRIAAAEQLRTYANILDIPFRVIYSVEETVNAIRDFKDSDYILIDTAGHSHHNEQQKNTMKELIHSVDDLCEKEVYLVVSATTKYRDLLSIADTYTEMTDYKLIFTKLDETTTFGNLLNLRLHTGAPMSYVTYGQNVPDDIAVFNPQNTVKQLLGGK